MENKKDFKTEIRISGSEFWAPALGIFSRFSAWIMGPVFVGAGIGIYLDKKFNTEPRIFLISIAVSFVISIIGLGRDALNEYKKQEERDKQRKNIK